jgi:hypothetical protein
METQNRHGNTHSGKMAVAGIARVSDVVTVPASSVDLDPDHPAKTPPELMRHYILALAQADGLVVDPFCACGTGCLVAQSEDLPFAGVDSGISPKPGERYADMTNRRSATEAKYARGGVACGDRSAGTGARIRS